MSEDQMRVTPAVRKAMLDDFEVLEKQNHALTHKNMELVGLNESLLQERNMLREELDRRTAQFQKVQAYGARLGAQLDMITDAVEIWMDHGTAIKQVIAKVKDEARRVQDTTRVVPNVAPVDPGRGESPSTSEALRRLNLIGHN